MAYVTANFDDEIVRRLKGGEVGLLPSDTIYGLSCQALDRGAVERLHRLKGRGPNKPFIVLISDVKMLDLLSISTDQAEFVKNYWPGAVSVIFPSKAPDFLTRNSGSLAVRLPDYPILTALIDQVGPLVSTSANLAGGTPLKSAGQAKDLFGDELDFYVDLGELDNPPSALAMVENGHLKVVRQGAVKIG